MLYTKLGNHKIYVDLSRLKALHKEIEKNPELRKYYPDFINTFNKMLAADVVMKYQSLSGVHKGLFNSNLLFESAKSGIKFLCPVPGAYS